MEKFEPHKFNTHDPLLRKHFESYAKSRIYENGESEHDDVREEIAKTYGVPLEHIIVIDNKRVDHLRHKRAFCVLIRKQEGKESGWYIDGRLPHVALLGNLFSEHGIPDDEHNERILGFLDAEGFPDMEEIQKKAKEQGKPITWFVRTVAHAS